MQKYEFFSTPSALYGVHTAEELGITRESLNNYFSRQGDKPVKIYTNNNFVIELVRGIGYEELGIRQMMELKGLKDRKNFIDYHLEPALKEKLVCRKYPDRPNHPRQKYLLTVKGQMLYQELKKE